MSIEPLFTDRQARLLIDNAVDYAVIGIDLNGVITSWNVGAFNIMGWSSAEAVGNSVGLIFTHDDVDARIPAAEMSAAIRAGRGVDERWHLRKDGTRFWANGEMMPMRNESGILEGYMKVLRDRTEQHASYVALAESEERYRDLQNAMDEGFCLIEVSCDDVSRPIDYRFLEVNSAFERQTGLRDATGAWVRELVPDHEEHWFDVYAKIALTGEPARFELPAQGLNRWYEVFAYRVGNPEDRVIAVLFSDISERRNKENRLQAGEEHLRKLNGVLRSNEANLRLLLDTITEGFYATDRDGVTTTCNAAFLRMMGFARSEDVIGRKAHDLFHHSHADGLPYAEIACPIYKAAHDGIASHVADDWFFPIAAEPLRVEYWATPIVQDGVLQGAICTFQDVTERRHQEKLIEQTQQRRMALAQLNERLRNLEDLGEMSATAAELVGRSLNVSCAALGRIDTNGEMLVIDRDWSMAEQYSVAGAHPMRNYGSYIDDLLANQNVVVVDVSKDSRTAAFADIFEATGIHSFINVPILEQGKLAVIFCILSNRIRVWCEDEIHFVQEAAERTRIAIERKRAEQKLAYTERLRYALGNLSDQLQRMEDVSTMQTTAAELIGKTLDSARVGYGLIDDTAEIFTVPSDWAKPGFPSLAGTYFLDAYGRYAAELRKGSTVVINDVRIDPRTADNPAPLVELSVVSLINHPVVEQGRTVAILYVNNAEPRVWRDEEVGFLRDAGDRLRQATERKRAELSLQDLNARLESEVEVRTAERDRMWNISPDLMVVLSPSGIYRRANPAWATVLGYEPAQLVGVQCTDLSHPDDLSATTQALEKAQENLLPIFENRIRHQNGSYRWIQWVAAPGHDEIFATGRDITEGKEAQERLFQAESQLRQSQKMEAVGQLTGGLAHDFNNLLAGISGAVDMMQMRTRQGRFSDFERYLTIAQGAARRAAALTHRLLAFSRRQTLDPKLTDLNRLVNGMQELIQRTVGPSTLIDVIETEHLWSVLVDPSQLENALLNLCINGRDAMPDGGKITVETSNKSIDERGAQRFDLPSGDYVLLCVTDTGTGMSPEIVARVFEPFFTTKPMGEGTGLGLSMIYGFAQQSGGQIRIHSQEGKGTSVCIYLPRQYGAAESDQINIQLGPQERSKQSTTVLIVDDEPTVRMLVVDILEEMGYVAIEASDSVSGLKILESTEKIDLLISDVGLPGGMNGRQMADAARVKRNDLNVLFITGYAENAVIGNGHLDPGMEILTKPFSMDTLAVRIRSLIEPQRKNV